MGKKKYIDILKNMGFWTIVLIFMETIFRIIMNYSFNIESYLNIVFYSVLLSCIFCILLNLLKKRQTLITIIILLVLAVLFSVPCVFYNVYKTYFSLSNLELADQVGGFIDMAISVIFKNMLFIFLYFVPLIIYIIFRKKLNFNQSSVFVPIVYILIFGIFLTCYYTNIYLSKDKLNGSYKLYMEVNNISLNYEKFGVLNFIRIDTMRYIFGFEEKTVIQKIEIEEESTIENQDLSEKTIEQKIYKDNIEELNFDKPTNNSEIQTINEYMQEEQPTKQNEYTGIFKGYNLIYITAESFYGPAIDKDLTPTLYELTHSGFVFNNFYTPNVLSTIGGEFQSLTGLFPSKDILTKWREGTNYFPYGLATSFSNSGYNTYAYHNHYYGFQDRYKYIRTQGFDNFLAVGNGMEKIVNSNIWPESDIEMMQGTVDNYNDLDVPFLAYYMTVSGHMEYNWDNAMALKNKDEVQDLDLPYEAKAYTATLIELDRALQVLIDDLKEKGKLDNTVFVLLADHYPYALSLDSINSFSDYERDEIVEANHNNLIIWNSKMQTINIDKVCMSCDVLPTVLNLFGIEYDSRMFTGKDILSSSMGLAFFENRSWVTDKGTYFTAQDEFISKAGFENTTDEYVNNINNIVQNRINIARWIIKNNYYNYLYN